ncbi:MAG: DnaD domain protein [Christensenellales bacterium]
MAFIKQSVELKNSNFTLVNNFFISNFMPNAPENAVKVYLTGLYYLSLNTDANTIENFCESLKLSKTEIQNAFLYWEKEGLVKISDIDSLEVIYLPIDAKTVKFKPIDESKYGDLFVIIQSFLTRQMTQNEFKDYVALIEHDKLERDAMIMIAKYCADKDENIPANYILTIAKNWISEGILTTKKVEEKIKQLEKSSENIKNLFMVLGLSRNASLDECDMYNVWTKSFHYTPSVILSVAESQHKKGGMKALDAKIRKYHSMQLYSDDEIKEYEQNRKHYLTLAKEICSRLGIFVENLEPVIENYLNSWLFKGYMDETLKVIANFCFKTENNSLDKMDLIIQKLYKQGCVSLEAITQYINDLNIIDQNIKQIFEVLGIKRIVTSRDRELYNIWCDEWNIPTDLLNYAVQLSTDKTAPFQYLNKVLTNFHEKNITTIEEAKNLNSAMQFGQNSSQNIDMNTRSYSDEELNRLFDNLKEIDV